MVCGFCGGVLSSGLVRNKKKRTRPLAIGGKESGYAGFFHFFEFFSSEAARVKILRWFGTPGQW